MEITLNVKIGITEELQSFISALVFHNQPKAKTLFGSPTEVPGEAIIEETNGKVKKEKKAKADPAPAKTIEDVRAVMAPLQKAGKRAQLKSILTEMGVENIPSLPEDKYQDFIDKMNDL